MALDIFSYRADSSRMEQQQPPMGRATVSKPRQPSHRASLRPTEDREQTPWGQMNIPRPLERDDARLLDLMKGELMSSLPPGRSQDLQKSSLHQRGKEMLSPGLSDTTDVRLRCFEHDCGGRTFSCAENYRRHVREKEGAAKVHCTLCRMSFTRKSNLRKHVLERRCQTLIKRDEMRGTASSTLRSSHVPL